MASKNKAPPFFVQIQRVNVHDLNDSLLFGTKSTAPAEMADPVVLQLVKEVSSNMGVDGALPKETVSTSAAPPYFADVQFENEDFFTKKSEIDFTYSAPPESAPEHSLKAQLVMEALKI